MSITSKFLKNVEKHRNNKPADKFKGYLADYLLLVEADPLVANLRFITISPNISLGWNGL